MPIFLVIVGALLVGITDRLQPDSYRKPAINRYLGYVGGIIWFVGIVLAFIDYKLLNAILLLVASFIIGAFVGIKPNKS